MPTLLASIALVLAVLALVVALLTYLRVRPGGDDLPADAIGLRKEVAALRKEAAGALRHLAVARAARRRRRRRRPHLDPGPQRGPHLRQERHVVAERPGAVTRGVRGDH